MKRAIITMLIIVAILSQVRITDYNPELYKNKEAQIIQEQREEEAKERAIKALAQLEEDKKGPDSENR